MKRIIDSTGQCVLKDRVFLIYGMSSDIGIEISKLLLENGAFISGTYYKGEKPVKSLQDKYGENIILFEYNALSESFEKDAEKIIEGTYKWKNQLDVLINVAGIWMIKPFLYSKNTERKTIWRINYESQFVFCQSAVRKFMAKGKGEIINIASTSGIRGVGQQTSYAASKAALINFTQSLAEEFGPRGIKANAISPGPVDTKALRKYFDEVGKQLLIKNIPISRLCKPKDVANGVLGILINDYMTGNNVILHGGKL